MGEPPGSFGIESLKQKVAELQQSVTALSRLLTEVSRQGKQTHQEVERVAHLLKKQGDKTMADLNSLKDLVDGLRGDAAQEAQEVKAKLDEMQASIDELKQNANDPAKVQEIADDLAQAREDVKNIFTGDQTPPGGRRK